MRVCFILLASAFALVLALPANALASDWDQYTGRTDTAGWTDTQWRDALRDNVIVKMQARYFPEWMTWNDILAMRNGRTASGLPKGDPMPEKVRRAMGR